MPNVWRLLILLVGLTAPPCCTADDAREPAQRLQGAAFNLALDRMVSVSRGECPLLPTLESLSKSQNLSVLLDRRIDPDQLVFADLRRMRVRTVLGNLASQSDAGISVVGDTIYVGPLSAVRRLRTLVDVLGNDLRTDEPSPGKRLFELLRRQPVVWDELTEPRQVIVQVAEDYGLQIEGLEQVPHDLWRAGQITNANATEALLLLLMQFDLSLEWLPEGQGIRLVPAPEAVTIPRDHMPRNMSLEQAESLLQETFPELEIHVEGKHLRLQATLEEHETIAELLGAKPKTDLGESRKDVVLSRQRFTLKAVGLPVSQLLESLQLDGVQIDYDVDALGAAGVDLGTRVNLELDKATVQQLMDAVTQQVKLKYEITGNVITLSPPVVERQP